MVVGLNIRIAQRFLKKPKIGRRQKIDATRVVVEYGRAAASDRRHFRPAFWPSGLAPRMPPKFRSAIPALDIVCFFITSSDIGGAMSDGPHRSLPMRRAWKELAKRADQRTYNSAQVREAVPHALASDWNNEVSAPLIAALKNVFAGRYNSLRFPEIALDQLEAARTLAAGSVFGTNAVSWCIQLVHEGRMDLDALYEAVGLAAKERGFAGTRQVEEHYLRQSSQRRSDGVSARLESAVSGLSEGKLGAMIIDPQPGARSAPRKRTDINDGVPLQ